MTTPSLLLPNTRTESEAREDIARKDRQGWYASGKYIVRDDIREIVHCDRRDVRDQILLMARSWDAMKDALEECADDLEVEINARAIGELPRRIAVDLKAVARARAALALARAKP